MSLAVSRPCSVPTGLTLISDVHLGAADCDVTLLRSDLRRARDYGDRILINGDLFDLVTPSDSKKFRPSVIHPRLRGRDDLIDAVGEWALEEFGPYADLIDVIGTGNHDAWAPKKHHTNPLHRLVRDLNQLLSSSRSRHRVANGGYCGFVVYKLSSGRKYTVLYHHGWGKGSSLKSAAGTYDALHQFEGVDLYWLGHLHARMTAHLYRVCPPETGDVPVEREVRFVRTGSYLKVWGGQDGEDGRKTNYAAEANLIAHGRGGVRVLLGERVEVVS